MNQSEKYEWDLEEDFYELKLNGFDCEIKRHPSLKTLNGYVYLEEYHPYFGMEYLEIEDDIYVHGGLTYSNVSDGRWKIGFDCAHSGDLMPSSHLRFLNTPLHNNTDIYRNVDYVKNELDNLTKQLSEVK